jgi:hypothetical protein
MLLPDIAAPSESAHLHVIIATPHPQMGAVRGESK